MEIIKEIFTGESTNILNSFPDGVIVVDFLRKITYCNNKAEEIFGYTKKEITGKKLSVLFPSDIEKLSENIGSGTGTLLKAVTKNADEIFVDVSAVDFFNSAKVIISIRPVSEKFLILQGLLNDLDTTKKLVKKRDSFLSTLELDFKNPINSVVGFSSALIEGLCGELNEKQEKYANIINNNGKKLSSLISKVLSIIELDADKKEFRPKNYDIVKIIDFVTQTYKLKVNPEKVEFNVDYSKLEKRNCYGDEYLLREVLSLIIDNAVKFTTNGRIDVIVEHPDIEFILNNGMKVPVGYNEKSFIHAIVQDTGIGISKDLLNKIFNEFEEKDKSITQKYGGIGLSLPIAKKIIEKIDGVIWVESEPMQGSAFHFIIPVEKMRFSEF